MMTSLKWDVGRRALTLGALAALTLGGLAAGHARAAIIDYGTYQLHNHPDGNQRPPFYGLRLDELYNATAGHDVFTWDFDYDDGVNQSAMFLTYESTMSGERIRIFGTSWGGRDGGVAYDGVYDGLWEIDFELNLIAGAPGDDDLIGDADHGGARDGYIKRLSNDDEFDLFGFPMGYSFRLGDEDNDLGHRGFDGVSGWGWLNHGSGGHIESSDWLFTVGEEIPEPATLLLVLGGLAASGVRRFRS